MTAVLQLDLLATPDPARDAVLALICGDPLHARDRAAVVDAIRRSVRADGTCSSNDWRPLIPSHVYPAVIGAVVAALARADVLLPTDAWVMSTDVKSRNGNKPTRIWRWREPPP